MGAAAYFAVRFRAPFASGWTRPIHWFSNSGKWGQPALFRYFGFAPLDHILFCQLYYKAPQEVNPWFPRHNGRLPRKGRRVNT
jgi:hypothetical protein